MPVKRISFYSEGSRLEGDFYLPDGQGVGERRPAIILCHGYSGTKEVILPDFARIFAAAGYPTLCFDYRGFGGSGGPKWRIIPHEQIQDIRNAITWIESQPEVDLQRIGIWGTSNGGALVISVAAADERVKCVVGQIGFGDGRRLLMDRFTQEEREEYLTFLRNDRRKRVLTGKGKMGSPGELLNSDETRQAAAEALKYMPAIYCEISYESADAILEYRPIDVVDKISPRPLMLIAGDKDILCAPDGYRAAFDRAGEPKRWISYPVGHYDMYKPEWVEPSAVAAVEWFKEHLKQ